MHPNLEVGNDILSLASNDKKRFFEAYVEPKKLPLKERIGGAEIFEELDKHPRGFLHGFEKGIHIESSEKNLKRFWKGWMASDDKQDPLQDHHTPFAAFNVTLNDPKKGIWRCISGDSIERTFREYTYPTAKSSSDRLPFSSVVTPGGWITFCHNDGCGCGQLLWQLFGTKLMFWWELEGDIMEMYGPLHHRNKGDFLRRAVKEWPGLKWTILGPGDYIVMNPGTVHAVLSPVNSVVGGIYLLDQEWIKNGSVETKISWHFDKIEAMIEDPSEDHENIAEILNIIEKVDVELWGRLRRNTTDHDLIQKLENLETLTKEKIRTIRNHKGFRENQKIHSKK